MAKTFILGIIALLLSATPRTQTTLTVSIKGLKKNGTLMIGLYNKSEGFGKTENTFRNLKSYASPNEVQLNWTDLPKGTYAVAIFQDLNNNGKLDKNFIGKPTEPYAFSNNIKPVFSAPTFEDCKFNYKGNETIKITLINP